MKNQNVWGMVKRAWQKLIKKLKSNLYLMLKDKDLIVMCSVMLLAVFIGIIADIHTQKEIVEIVSETTLTWEPIEVSGNNVVIDTESFETVTESTEEELIEEEIFCDSFEYVAQCVEAEAGNQGELGKRYVADCIFNRFDLGGYNNMYEVINEDGQFTCVKNGAILCEPTEETYKIVYEEWENRTNAEILYFRTDHYHSFADDCFQYKDHYFSK